MSIADLKRRWRDGETTYVVTVRLGLPLIVEMLAASGVDIVKIDLETGFNPPDALLSMLQAMKGTEAVSVVKIPTIDPRLIGQLLDLGVEGVVVPIDSRADAVQAVNAFAHHPEGHRSNLQIRTKYLPGGPGREVLCIAQIESALALSNIEEIVSTPGIDQANVGLVDIAASLGIPGQSSVVLPGAQEDAVREIIRVCKAHGVPCGTQGAPEAMKALGFQVIGLGADIGFFESAMRAALATRC